MIPETWQPNRNDPQGHGLRAKPTSVTTAVHWTDASLCRILHDHIQRHLHKGCRVSAKGLSAEASRTLALGVTPAMAYATNKVRRRSK